MKIYKTDGHTPQSLCDSSSILEEQLKKFTLFHFDTPLFFFYDRQLFHLDFVAVMDIDTGSFRFFVIDDASYRIPRIWSFF